MKYQIKGLQVSFLLHAILITLLALLSRSVMQVPKPIMLDFSIISDIAAGDCAVKKETVPAARQAAPEKTSTRPVAVAQRHEQTVMQEPARSVFLPAPAQPEQVSIPAAQPTQTLSGATGPVSSAQPPVGSNTAGQSVAVSSGGGFATGTTREGAGNRVGQTDGTVEFGSSSGPSFLRRELPAYPQMARRMGKEARVVLRLTIDEKGGLVHVETVEDPGFGFADAAIEAVRKSSFVPAKQDGKRVTVVALLSVRFQLKRAE
jgi:TonB family protein